MSPRFAWAGVLFALVIPASAQASITTTVPATPEARGFATTAGGWTGGANTAYANTGGTRGPTDGHLNTSFSTLFSATQATWRSPRFTADDVSSGTLSVAVRPQLSAKLKTALVDVAAGTSIPVAETSLTASSSFSTISSAIPNGALVDGRAYAIELGVNVTALAGVGSVGLDDVALTLIDIDPPSGLEASIAAMAITGTVDPQGQPTTVTAEYGATTAYGSTTPPVVLHGTGAKGFSLPLPGLTPGATYHWRVTATNGDGTVHSQDTTLTVPPPPVNAAPSVTGALNSRTRTAVYDLVSGTLSARFEILDAGGNVVSTVEDADHDGTHPITLPDTDGTYTVVVTQTAANGLSATSPATQVILDTVAPVAGGAPTVGGAGNSRSRTVAFTRAGDTTSIAAEVLDANDQIAFMTPTTTVTLPDVDGTYRVRVRQFDAAGNSSVTGATAVTLDRVAPVAGPAPVLTGATNVRPRTAVFQRAPDAVSATLQVFGSDENWRVSFDVLVNGQMTIMLPDMDDTFSVRVRQTDAAGNSAYTTMTQAMLLRTTDVDGGDNDEDEQGTIDPGADAGAGGEDPGATGGAGAGDPPDTPVAMTPKLTDPGGYGALLTDCYGSDVALTDVRKAGKSIAISGLTAYAPGTSIAIRDDRGRTVATASSGTTGRFAATVAPGATSYQALVGGDVSRAVKWQRASMIDAISVTGNVAQVDGKVKASTKQLSVHGGRGAGACKGASKTLTLASKAKLNRRTGAFSVRVKLPKGNGLIALSVGDSIYAVR